MSRAEPTSSVTRRVIAVSAEDVAAARREAWSALFETTKPGITKLVAFTSFAGFALAAIARGDLRGQAIPALGCVVGTTLAAAGANALNMWLEAPRDALMPRTRERPIPSGRLAPRTVATWGTWLVIAGVAVLAASAGAAPALLALLSAASYLFVYTPLKTRTAWCTLVGAVPGALPTLIGASAATAADGASSMLEPAGVALFAMLTVWQLPHFFALAWMYRHDYTAGGMRMLTVVDPTGRKNWLATVATAALLVPAAMAPAFASPVLGLPYALIAGVASAALLVMAVRLARSPSDAAARRLFFASILHLPLLLTAMMVEAATRLLV